MIKKLDLKRADTAKAVLDLQMESYRIEAEIIQFYDIPTLKDTIESIRQCGEIFHGYFIEDTLAGIISWKIEDETLDIHRVAIDPKFFRRGIAKKLLNFIEEHNVNKIIVSTGKGNTPAIKLYLKMGYKKVKDIKISEDMYLTLFEKYI